MPLKDCLTKAGFTKAEIDIFSQRLKDFEKKEGENQDQRATRMVNEILQPELLSDLESIREQLGVEIPAAPENIAQDEPVQPKPVRKAVSETPEGEGGVQVLEEVVPDDEYRNYKGTLNITQERADSITEKAEAGQQLTEREQEIYNDIQDDVVDIVAPDKYTLTPALKKKGVTQQDVDTANESARVDFLDEETPLQVSERRKKRKAAEAEAERVGIEDEGKAEEAALAEEADSKKKPTPKKTTPKKATPKATESKTAPKTKQPTTRRTNVREVELDLSAAQVSRIKRNKAFSKLFTKKQRDAMQEGTNTLRVNQTVFGRLREGALGIGGEGTFRDAKQAAVERATETKDVSATAKKSTPKPKKKPAAEVKPKAEPPKPKTKLEEIRERLAMEDEIRAKREAESKPDKAPEKPSKKTKESPKGKRQVDSIQRHVDVDGTSGFKLTENGITMLILKDKKGKWRIGPSFEALDDVDTFDTFPELRSALSTNENGIADKVEAAAQFVKEERARLEAEKKAKAKESKEKGIIEKTEQEIDDESIAEIIEAREDIAFSEDEQAEFAEYATMMSEGKKLNAEQQQRFDELSKKYHEEFPLGDFGEVDMSKTLGLEPRTPTKAELTQLTEDAKKLQRFLKRIVPNLRVKVFANGIAMANAFNEDIGISNLQLINPELQQRYIDNAMSSGLYSAATQTIYLNANLLTDNVIFHEAAHPLIDAIFSIRPDLKNTFYNELLELEKTYPEITEYIEFSQAESYKEGAKYKEEAVVEFLADVLAGKINPADFGSKSILDKIKTYAMRLFSKVLEGFGMEPKIISDKHILNLAESLRQAYFNGEVLQVNMDHEAYNNAKVEAAVEQINEQALDLEATTEQIRREAIKATEGGTKDASRADIQSALDTLYSGLESEFIDGVRMASLGARGLREATKIINSTYSDVLKVKLLERLGVSTKDAKAMVAGKITPSGRKITKKRGPKPKAKKKPKPKISPGPFTNVTPTTWASLDRKEKVRVNQYMQRFEKSIKKEAKADLKDKTLANFSKLQKLLGKMLPDLNLQWHDNNISYRIAVAKATGSGSKRNTFTNGFYDGTTQTIHINGPLAAANTLFHEGGHALMDAVFNIAPELRDAFYTDLVRLARLNPEIDQYIQYGQNKLYDSDVEAIVEFMADVLSGKIKPEKLNISTLQKIKNDIKDIIKKMFNTFGIEVDRLSNSGLVDFSKSIREAYYVGKELQGPPVLKSDGKVSFQQPNIINRVLSNKNLSDNVKIAILESLGYTTVQATTMVNNFNTRQANPNIATRPHAKNPQVDILVEDAAIELRKIMQSGISKDRALHGFTRKVKRGDAVRDRYGNIVKKGKTTLRYDKPQTVSFDGVIDRFYDPLLNVAVDKFETMIRAEFESQTMTMNELLKVKEGKVTVNDLLKSKWYNTKNNFRAAFGLSLRGQLKDIYIGKRGDVSKQEAFARRNLRVLSKLTKDLNDADKMAVMDMLRGGSVDLLSENVDADTKAKLGETITFLREHLDALSRQLIALLPKTPENNAVFETIQDNKGVYINRIYLRNITERTRADVPQRIWDRAKAQYRAELTSALADGRVKDSKKRDIKHLLTDDAALENFMEGILRSKTDSVFRAGGLEGSKDTTILKKRRDVPLIIREFWGEVQNPELNYINTVGKLASYIANTRMLNDLQSVDRAITSGMRKKNAIRKKNGKKPIPYEPIFSTVERKGWVEVNRSNSDTLYPLDSPLFIRPDVHKQLEIKRSDMSRWLKRFLIFNGAVKGNLTILSEVTQARNFLSALLAWMPALGVINITRPDLGFGAKPIKEALDIMTFIGRKEFNEILPKALGGVAYNADEINMTPKEAFILRLVKLQVINQNVTGNEISRDFFKGVKMNQKMARWWSDTGDAYGRKAKGSRVLRAAKKAPAKLYEGVDDFFRVSFFMSEVHKYSGAMFNEKYENLTQEQKAQVEEKAARNVRAMYPNYSQIFPIVATLRKIPIMGAFVSFSAEMIRTTINQVAITFQELSDPNPKVRRIGAERLAGQMVVWAATLGLPTIMRMMSDEISDEEWDDIQKDRAPWEEQIIPLSRTGPGQYRVFNPSTINPYGYFSDILQAGINQKGTPEHNFALWLTDGIAEAITNEKPEYGFGRGVVAAGWKMLEPFLGPEVTFDVFLTTYGEFEDPTNLRTDGEKFQRAFIKTAERLAPGSINTFLRIYRAEKDFEETDDPAAEQKARTERLSLTGFRLRTSDASLNFRVRKGEQLVKEKAAAKWHFWGNAWRADRLKDKDRKIKELRELKNESTKRYRQSLDNARDELRRLYRLGIPPEELRALYGVGKDNPGPSWSTTRAWSNAEYDYIFGRTDRYPDLKFRGYFGD